MLEKNQIYEATITDYTTEGQGIAHIDGITVFIPNAIVGERVRVRIETLRKTWAAGNLPTGSTGNARWPSSAAAVISGTWTTGRKPD